MTNKIGIYTIVRGWTWGFLILGSIFAFGPLYGQTDWEIERSEILDEVAILLTTTAGEARGDSLLIYLEERAREENDSLVMLKVYIARVNSHINNEIYVDSVLDLMYPMLPAGTIRDSVEYYIDRSFAANIRGEYIQQIALMDSAITLAEQGEDSLQMYYCLIELAGAYQNVDDYKASLRTTRRARTFLDLEKNPFFAAYFYSTLGISHEFGGVSDSAIYYYQKSSKLYREWGSTHEALYTEAIQGKYYLDRGDLEKAQQLLEPACDTLFINGGDQFVRESYSNIWIWVAELYHDLGDYEQGKEAALIAYHLADSLNHASERIDALHLLLKLELVDQPEVLNYYNLLNMGKEEVHEDHNQRAVLEYERKYRVHEAEQEVTRLEHAAELQAQNARFRVIIALAVLILIAMVIGLFWFRSRLNTIKQIDDLNRKALQLQINPHFFFNALNSIGNFVGKNDQKSAHFYLTRFAKLMRLSLESSREKFVELGKEMDFIKAYLDLEKLRKDEFEYEVIYPENLSEVMIPPMFIQPFVENAVEHAFGGDFSGSQGKILVRAKQTREFLEIEVEDNGSGMGSNSSAEGMTRKTSLALQIQQERLALYGKKKAQMRIEKAFPKKKQQPGTRVILQFSLA